MMDITGKTAIVTGAAPDIGGDGQSCPLTGHPQQYRELAGRGGKRSSGQGAVDSGDAPTAVIRPISVERFKTCRHGSPAAGIPHAERD